MKVAKGRFALIDVGGGSVEISICRAKEVLHSESFLLGTARLQQVFLKSSPPRQPSRGEISPIEQLRRYIRSTLLSKMISEEWPKVDRVIGSSGTIRAIQRIMKKVNDERAIEIKDLKKLVGQMSTMTTTQLLGLPGMEARKRVDMILAGAILIEESMHALGAKKLIHHHYRFATEYWKRRLGFTRQHKRSHITLHMEDFLPPRPAVSGPWRGKLTSNRWSTSPKLSLTA